MPLYDYDCAACGRRFEVVHGLHAAGPEACPHCGGGPVRKAVTAPAVHFKGSGWAKKERRAGAGSGAKSGADTGSGEAGKEAAPAGPASDDAGTATPTAAPAATPAAGSGAPAD